MRFDKHEKIAINSAVKTDAALCIRWEVIVSDIA